MIIEEMGCGTCFKMQKILRDEIDDPEFLGFAIEDLHELLSYIIKRYLSIRTHRNIADMMWLGVG